MVVGGGLGSNQPYRHGPAVTRPRPRVMLVDDVEDNREIMPSSSGTPGSRSISPAMALPPSGRPKRTGRTSS